MTISALDLIKSLYSPGSKTYDILLSHSEQVTRKALAVSNNLKHLKPDMEFISQAAMLHDIGIGFTRSPSLGCIGTHPYICHGVLGRKLLDKEGLFKHARVCERHIGVGIYAQEIERLNLPLPDREMLPISLEEKIICYADKFFSKSNNTTIKEKSIPQIINGLKRYGTDKMIRFKKLHLELTLN